MPGSAPWKPAAAMPPFSYQCPRCGGVLKVDPAFVGRTLQCGRCQQKIEAANPLQVVGQGVLPVDRGPAPIPTRAKLSEEFKELAEDRRADAREKAMAEFLLKFGVVFLGILVIGGISAAVWAIAQAVATIPEP